MQHRQKDENMQEKLRNITAIRKSVWNAKNKRKREQGTGYQRTE